jgi:ribosomal protein S18 acetylase RimI-like enzyme
MRIRELRAVDGERWSGPCVSGAHQDHAGRIAFLEQHGFHLGGNFSEVNMIRSLDGQIPVASVPAGVKVRSLAVSEISTRAEAIRDVWKPWSVGNVTDENYAYFMQLPGYDRHLDVVAVAQGGIVAAYVNGWIDPLNRLGDIGPLGAREAYRRQGLTRAVLLECFRRMQARGMNRVIVSTGVSNTAAINLYQSLGFKIVNRYLEYVK